MGKASVFLAFSLHALSSSHRDMAVCVYRMLTASVARWL